MKSIQIRSFFWSVFSCIWIEYGDLLEISAFSPNTVKHGPEKTPHLDTFHAMSKQAFQQYIGHINRLMSWNGYSKYVRNSIIQRLDSNINRKDSINNKKSDRKLFV